jgi:hypothetical protein
MSDVSDIQISCAFSSNTSPRRNHLPLSNEEKQALQNYCIAHTRIEQVKRVFQNQRQELNQERKMCKSMLSEFMTVNNQSCVPVSIVDPETQEMKEMYVRLKQDTSNRPVTSELLQQAVNQVTNEDLAEYVDALDPSLSAYAKAWKAAIQKHLRALTSTCKTSVTVTDKKERKKGGGRGKKKKNVEEEDEDFRARVEVPERIVDFAQQYVHLGEQLKHQSSAEKKKRSSEEVRIQETEPVLTEFLKRFEPAKRSQEVMMTHRGEARTYYLRYKTSSQAKPVRITTFERVLGPAVSRVVNSAPDVDFSIPSSDAKDRFVQVLSEEYTRLLESDRQVKETVALDKGPGQRQRAQRMEIEGDDDGEDEKEEYQEQPEEGEGEGEEE